MKMSLCKIINPSVIFHSLLLYATQWLWIRDYFCFLVACMFLHGISFDRLLNRRAWRTLPVYPLKLMTFASAWLKTSRVQLFPAGNFVVVALNSLSVRWRGLWSPLRINVDHWWDTNLKIIIFLCGWTSLSPSVFFVSFLSNGEAQKWRVSREIHACLSMNNSLPRKIFMSRWSNSIVTEVVSLDKKRKMIGPCNIFNAR